MKDKITEKLLIDIVVICFHFSIFESLETTRL